MQLETVGEVIAERELYIQQPDGSRKTVTVRIGRPQRFPDPTENYFVPYQILGVGSEGVHYAGGVDTVQALQLVMLIIGSHLSSINQESEEPIRWDGAVGGDLGFPVYASPEEEVG